MQIQGKFVDVDGNRPQGRYVSRHLFRRCHGAIHRLLSPSKPVSEEPHPPCATLSWRPRVTHRFSTVKRCLNKVHKHGGPFPSEPVSEELMPIANKLSTVKKCLDEVSKYGGPFSPRDLYPYQLALYQIDSMRKDGRFIGRDGNIPKGQSVVIAHLNECHELLEMLKQSMDEESDPDYKEDEECDTASDLTD